MKNLVSRNKFTDALTVAETINWRKVHNINDILAGSESYEAAGKLEESRDLLLLAHERSPIGRMILYKLCIISIKLKELDEAQEYYNEFVQIAPHDSLKYILKYHINVAKGADNATLIKILEQLKDNDLIEEWAYELAYLYHKTNQAEKCIELCDEIILWFGDGPVVERALELKMLYQPLDKNQETKYRHMQQKKDGITEITANEPLLSGEIVPHTVAIPSVELPSGPERFNTINLQAEIKKNIDEIMKATEAGEVNENIDAIKNLVEEIPYLQVQEETPSEPVKEEFSINDTFQQYLAEGYDGQISLKLPDDSPVEEEQIEGQMTIEDVLAEWEKTKRAAEAAMEDAKSNELENARAKALREANNVLNRLEGAMSKLDAGMTSSELLKEEYLSNSDDYNETASNEEPINEVDNELDSDKFEIPKINIEGANLGSLEIPVVHTHAVEPAAAAAAISALTHSAEAAKDTTSWQPPTLDDTETIEENEEVDFKEASQMIADVNELLQKEIDRLSGDTAKAADTVEEAQPEIKPVEVTQQIEIPEDIKDVEVKIPEFTLNNNEEDDSFTVADDAQYADVEAENTAVGADVLDDDIELPKIELSPELFAEDISPEPIPVEKVTLEEEPNTHVEPVTYPQEPVQLQEEAEPVDSTAEKKSEFTLEDDDLSTFSYFLPISGMKSNIVKVVKGAADRLDNPMSTGGNIIIVGEPGSGKTQMATSIIRVLEKKVGKPKGGIGKISGAKLNEKDIQKLYSKIQGGCLIIETAGDISKETAVTLSLLMENDNTGTIIIIEDNRKGIEKALLLDGSFAKRFTEKIVIPIFSIDELVSFAKTYAKEAGCFIDDMGVLALYNRINLIGRYDHATTIKEVAEIMDEAIEKSTRGGFFNKPKYDKYGNVILKEKDFD